MMLLVVLRLFSVDLMPTEIGVRYVVASVMWSVRQTTRQGTINSGRNENFSLRGPAHLRLMWRMYVSA
jgi:hypothetical protein